MSKFHTEFKSSYVVWDNYLNREIVRCADKKEALRLRKTLIKNGLTKERFKIIPYLSEQENIVRNK
jgi:hypothetical protein